MVIALDSKLEKLNPLALSLFWAIAIHTFIILGIGFSENKIEPTRPDKILDITLTKPVKKDTKPQKADFLSNSNQVGGQVKQGYSAPEKARSNPLPVKKPKPAPIPATKSGTVKNQKKIDQPIKVQKSKRAIQAKTIKPKASVPEPKKVNMAMLLRDTQLEIDRLTAELDQRSKIAATQKRRKHISASTQEYKYAAYMDAWRRKVENIGNLNYPDEAKRKKLYGSLLLHVSIRSDGTIANIRVARSSGHKILDDSAVRIVRLAAPFAPFPANIRKEVDILDITRTWQFRSGNQLFAN